MEEIVLFVALSIFAGFAMVKDEFGFKKLQKDLNDSFKFDIFPKEKQPRQKKRFSQPKPHYTNSNYRKPNYSKGYKETKKIAKETGSAFKTVINKIKNRKIRKLEKEALKAKEKAEKLAHEIKTKTALIDSNYDIKIYEKELEKINKEFENQKNNESIQEDDEN